MKTVYKYTLGIQDAPTDLTLPKGAIVRHVANQGGWLCLWIERPFGPNVEPEQEVRRFYVHGTGHPIPDDRVYVGTALSAPFVWHVYEGQ